MATAVSTSTPTATPTVTATQPKTPLATAGVPTTAVPRILSFTIEPVEVDPGQTVTLSWMSTGDVTATIEQHLPADLSGSLLSVSPSGNITVTIEEDERYWHEFKLVVANKAGNTVKQKVTVQIRCPYAYFFISAPTKGWGRCPARPAALTSAAEQLFEGGRMVWLQEIPKESTRSGLASEGPLIFVFYEDGRWLRFEDTWTTAEPERDPDLVPPEGMVQPQRGFGKVWGNNPQVREALGWASRPEQAFEGAYQHIWVPYYFTRSAYMRTADGRILLLDANGYWDFYRP
jgi:plastocyanin